MVLIYISLMISDVVPLFIYLWATCMSCFEECQLRSFAHSLKSSNLVSYISGVLTPYQIHNLQILSSIWEAVFALRWLFTLLCTSVLV